MTLQARWIAAAILPIILSGCDKLQERFGPEAERKHQELLEQVSQLQNHKIELPESLEMMDIDKGVYEFDTVHDGDSVRCLANVLQTHGHNQNVIITGCEKIDPGMDPGKRAESADKLDIPGVLYSYETNPGSYQVDLQRKDGQVSCIANVMHTYASRQNVIVSDCYDIDGP